MAALRPSCYSCRAGAAFDFFEKYSLPRPRIRSHPRTALLRGVIFAVVALTLLGDLSPVHTAMPNGCDPNHSFSEIVPGLTVEPAP